MIDLLFQIALSNLGISLALGIVAVIVGKTLKRPALAHLLWLLVFVKLLTPPIVTIPVVTLPWLADNSAAVIQDNSQLDIDGQRKAAADEKRGTVGPIVQTSPWTKVFFDLLPGWDRRGRGGS